MKNKKKNEFLLSIEKHQEVVKELNRYSLYEIINYWFEVNSKNLNHFELTEELLFPIDDMINEFAIDESKEVEVSGSFM